MHKNWYDSKLVGSAITGRPKVYGRPTSHSRPGIRLSPVFRCIFTEYKIAKIRSHRMTGHRTSVSLRKSGTTSAEHLLMDFRSSPDDRHIPDVRWLCVSYCFVAWWIPSDRTTGGLVERPVQSVPPDIRYSPNVRRLQCTEWLNDQFYTITIYSLLPPTG